MGVIELFERILSALPRDAIEKLSDTTPLIRPVDVPPHMGRAYTAPDGETWVRVTPRGHWRVSGPQDDSLTRRVCLGCDGAWLLCILEDHACPHAATAQDIATALLGPTAVAA